MRVGMEMINISKIVVPIHSVELISKSIGSRKVILIIAWFEVVRLSKLTKSAITARLAWSNTKIVQFLATLKKMEPDVTQDSRRWRKNTAKNKLQNATNVSMYKIWTEPLMDGNRAEKKLSIQMIFQNTNVHYTPMQHATGPHRFTKVRFYNAVL